MCGIIGVFNRENADDGVRRGLDILKNRGKDGFGIASETEYKFSKKLEGLKIKSSKNAIGHALHSVVNFVPQPIIGRGKLVSNCEIYNWKELNEKYKLNAKNDSHVLFKLLEKEKIEDVLEKLDGVFAFAYWRDEFLFLARDIIGEKPVWYCHQDGFSFASEKKALTGVGYIDVQELNPRQVIRYSIKGDKLSFPKRNFFSIAPEDKRRFEEIKADLKRHLADSIKKRIPNGKFGLLFSGGIDSSVIALVLKELKTDFVCYTAVLDDPALSAPEDLIYAEKAAKELDINLKIIKIKIEGVEKYLKQIVPLIEDSNVVKVGVAMAFFAACEAAKKDKIKVIFSGLGSEEIFGGYQRHKESANINKECLSGLLKIYERDTYRDDVVTMRHNLELRLPFLDKQLVEFSLKIPSRYKISGEHGKHILRKLAEEMGLKKEFAWRKKRAAQYGSKFDRAIKKLARKAGFKYRSDYLRRFYPQGNLKLGALASSGKDSLYAAYLMKKQGYSIGCLITLISENPESYMFHTPNVGMAKLQADAMGIPLIEQKTKGEKEKELADLKEALKKAKKEYNINGIITGALYSNYQRERIEKACDEAGLKVFSPLWHINQETEMRELINDGFEFVLSSVACDGLDSSWLGRAFDNKMVDKLVEINRKIGMNIAGEGGEYESLVLDCPLFNKKIKIIDYEILEEKKNTAKMVIKKAEVIGKSVNKFD